MYRVIITIAGTLIFSRNAIAHHAFAVDFDANTHGAIDGKVVEVFYKNPHARYYLEVTRDDGETETWDVQTMNLSILSRLGWKKDTIIVGDNVTITGNLGRNGTKRINILTLVEEDGTVWNPMPGRSVPDPPPAQSDAAEPAELADNSLENETSISPEEIVGHWLVTTTGFYERDWKSRFELTIEKTEDGYAGWIYNGPAPVSIDGSRITVGIDWNEGADSIYESQLVGALDSAGELSGEFIQMDEMRFNGLPLQNGVWSAIKMPASGASRKLVDAPQAPVDISGVWRNAIEKVGFNKMHFAMTPKALEISKNFDHVDTPHIRCAGNGLVTVKWLSGGYYPLEIFQDEDQIIFVYGSDYVRRIYLDGRSYPENREDTYLGFSTGKWIGDTLEVTTNHIAPTFLKAGHGRPISGNAHTIEHYFIDDDGYLRADMWIHDPDNYERPPYFPAYLQRSEEADVITKVGCDPHSFYRQLHLEGEMEEYFSRAEFRR